MASHTYNNIAAYFENLALKKLAGMFAEKFKRFTDTEAGKELVKAGPQI